MNQDPNIDQHSVGKSILLHLLPGILIGLCYFLLVIPLHQMGFPSIMALMTSFVVVLVPVELGYLLFLGKKKNGRFSLQGIVMYRSPIPGWQYFVWVPVLFVIVGVIFTVMKPIDVYLQNIFFFWLPAMESGLQEGFSKGNLIITYTMVAIFGAFIGPIVEEYYFRGFLLPRMNYAGKWAPLLSSFLFAIYHVFTPWMFITRTLGMLPLVYAVRRRNLFISVIVHVLVNLIDVVTGVSFILAMTNTL
jgi:membrane protease YdiL (CAAX protease family)